MSELKLREVLLQQDLCSNCGACMAYKTLRYCPQIQIPDELYMVDPVPRYRLALMTRSTDDNIRKVAQDGGTVTALCKLVLEKSLVKYVLGCKFGKGTVVAVPECVTSPTQITNLSKSKYVYVPVLSLLAKIPKEELDKVCVVGVPCQIRAASLIEKDLGKKMLKICILCSSNFKKEFILNILQKHNKKVEDIDRMEIKKKFRIIFKDGTIEEVSIKDAKKFSGKCCLQCPELMSHYADIVVGSMFLPEGWNFVLALTEKGEDVLNIAVKENVLEIKDVPTDVIQKVEQVAKQKQEQGKKIREEVTKYLKENGLLS